MNPNPKICLLVPCYNEGITIRKVVDDFRRELPEADIYVYDNNSTDNTVAEAEAAGAQVRREPLQGKGNVVRSMFRDIEADIYVMVDGDDTYPASSVRELIAPVLRGEADMVIGDRLSNGSYYQENSRSFHGLGNNLVRNAVNRFFKVQLHDIMTGYRVFSRRFVRAFPVLSSGFQLETEMTLFALRYRLRIVEIPIDFTERPEGSFSKLNTFSDGVKVILCILNMYRHYKPLAFFSLLALLVLAAAMAIGAPVVWEYIEFRYVYKVPSAVLASGLGIAAMLLFVCGILLDTLSHNERSRVEQILKIIDRI